MVDTRNKTPLLVVGFPSWNDEYVKSTLLLCTELARNHRLLYVEYPYTWKDVAMGALGKSKRPVRRIMGWESRIRELETDHGHKLHVLTLPPMLPINWLNHRRFFTRMAQSNALKARKAILKALAQLEIREFIMVNAFNPFLGNFLHATLGEKRSFYYCYDEIGHARWAGKYGKLLEEELLAKVDGLICSSQPLLDGRSTIQPNAEVVKNGVYFETFYPAVGLRKQRPAATPTFGYWGAIDDRLDFNLLDLCLASWPESQVLMVGKIHPSVKDHPLLKHPSVICPGPQPVDRLPSFAAKMDVGLIPFVKNGFTRGIYPMKINEYLASGLPVVSTDFGDLSDFEGVVGIAKDEAGFLHSLTEALEMTSEEDLNRRLDVAASNSWQQRGEAFSEILTRSERENVF